MTDVRLGIVSWNTAQLLDRCLGSLPPALGRLDAEIVVVDNASDDDSVAVARAHGVRVHVNDTNRGYAAAMNQALAGSDASVIIALNPDTEAPPNSLERLVEHLHADPAIGCVVPRLVHEDGTVQHSVLAFPTVPVSLAASFLPLAVRRTRIGQRLALPGAPPPREPQAIDWAIGAVHVLRAEAVPDPPYSERWFMYVEDLDLCWRLHRDGWQIRVDPSVSILHVGNAAGQQAWGTARDSRYWTATYQFVAGARGPFRARLLALANTAGVAWYLARTIIGRGLRGRRTSPEFRAKWGRVLAVHARAIHGRIRS